MDKCNATALNMPTRDRDDSSRVESGGRIVYFCFACGSLHPAYLFQPNGECKITLWGKTESVCRTLVPDPAKVPRDGRKQRKRQRRVPPAKKEPKTWKPITPRQ